MRNLFGLVATAAVLAGCTAYAPFDPLLTSGSLLTTEGSVTVKAVFVPGGYTNPTPAPILEVYRIAAVVPNHSKVSVDHLKVSFFSVEGEAETPLKDAGGLALVKTVKADDAEKGVTIPRLTIGKSYRVKATAYKASEGAEPVAISSEVTADFTLDKLKPTAEFNIRLFDVPFSGEIEFPGFEVTPSGELIHEGPVIIEIAPLA